MSDAVASLLLLSYMYGGCVSCRAKSCPSIGKMDGGVAQNTIELHRQCEINVKETTWKVEDDAEEFHNDAV